jgi:fucose permease
MTGSSRPISGNRTAGQTTVVCRAATPPSARRLWWYLVEHWREAFIGRELASAVGRLRFHWPEYLMESAEVGLYLFLTCVFASLLLFPASPVRHFIGSTLELRALMGLAVGAAVVAIVMTPWGKQSGGHFNPALTLAFYRLGKMRLPDAFFYVVAQFSGAIVGVCMARYLLPVGRPAIRYGVNRTRHSRQHCSFHR